MAARSDIEGLRAAWGALTGEREEEGWQTIPVAVRAPCTLFAGRRTPGGQEAVLIGFRSPLTLPDAHLPQGHGFEVLKLKTDPTGGNSLMLALARSVDGSLELFGLMAEDLVGLVDSCGIVEEDGVLRRFLARIHAWQDFMDRHREGVLPAESELGLFGELVLLERMLLAGVPPRLALDAWEGPRDGLHDFVLAAGGIEVKTTLTVGAFPAIVSSLEQLDESLRQPLFVAAIRLALDPSGKTLPEMANDVRVRLTDNHPVLEILEARLMQAGLVPTMVARYARRFRQASIAIMAVEKSFPRLTRANVHPVIRKARYEIDLDLAHLENIGLERALNSLGVA